MVASLEGRWAANTHEQERGRFAGKQKLGKWVNHFFVDEEHESS
jgi:hypothetical protein